MRPTTAPSNLTMAYKRPIGKRDKKFNRFGCLGQAELDTIRRYYFSNRRVNETARAIGCGKAVISKYFKRLKETGSLAGKVRRKPYTLKHGVQAVMVEQWTCKKIDPATLPDRYYHSNFEPA